MSDFIFIEFQKSSFNIVFVSLIIEAFRLEKWHWKLFKKNNWRNYFRDSRIALIVNLVDEASVATDEKLNIW